MSSDVAMVTSPGAPLVGVVFHRVDGDRAKAISEALAAAGLRVQPGSSSPECVAIVVLLSSELLEFPDRLPAAVQVPGARLVPVVTRRVEASAVPEDLAVLNWIPWSDDDPSNALRAVVSACSTDLEVFHAVEALTARAQGWQLAGRNNADLLIDRRQFSVAEATVQRAGAAELSIPVAEFVTASRAASRAHRTRLVLQRGGTLVLVAVLFVAIVTLVTQLASIRERRQLDLVTSRPQLLYYPPGHTLMATALIKLQHSQDEEPSRTAVDAVVRLMSEPWPVTRFQLSPGGMFLSAAEIADDGAMLWLDGQGTLWRVPPSGIGGERLGRPMAAANAERPPSALAADETWGTVAVADGDRLTVLAQGDRQELPVTGVSQLVIAPDGSELAVLTEDGRAERIDLTGPELARAEERAVPDALAIGVVSGRATALRTAEHGVELIALDDGTRLREFRLPSAAHTAAIGPTGWLAVQTEDGQLWTSDSGDNVVATGLRPDEVASMHITIRGTLLYAPAGRPFTQAFDLERRIMLENVCREGSVLDLRTSPNGRWLWCGYGADNSSWDLDATRVRGDGAPDLTPTMTADQDGVTVTVTPSGVLKVATNTNERRWDLAGIPASAGPVAPLSLQLSGGISTVALAHGPVAPVVLVGSGAGDIVVADLHPDGALRLAGRWSTPDGSPVQVLEVVDGAVVVTSSTGGWKVPACLNCSLDPGVLIETVRPRLLACYPRVMLDSVPMRHPLAPPATSSSRWADRRTRHDRSPIRARRPRHASRPRRAAALGCPPLAV